VTSTGSDPRSLGGQLLAGEPTEGRVLYTEDSLSFWGGYDQEDGRIIDRRHPLCGRHAAGRILALPETKGSSTTTAILLEAIRLGTAPDALITRGVDRFLVLAAVVAEELYGRSPAVVSLLPSDFELLGGYRWVSVDAEGRVSPKSTHVSAGDR